MSPISAILGLAGAVIFAISGILLAIVLEDKTTHFVTHGARLIRRRTRSGRARSWSGANTRACSARCCLPWRS